MAVGLLELVTLGWMSLVLRVRWASIVGLGMVWALLVGRVWWWWAWEAASAGKVLVLCLQVVWLLEWAWAWKVLPVRGLVRWWSRAWELAVWWASGCLGSLVSCHAILPIFGLALLDSVTC
jgi:hypothetical protein